MNDSSEVSCKEIQREKTYNTKEVMRKLRLPHATLLHWERLGVLSPRYTLSEGLRIKKYSKRDLERARLIQLLIKTGFYSFEKAVEKLEQLDH